MAEYAEGSEEWKVQQKYEKVIDMMLGNVMEQLTQCHETLRRIFARAGLPAPVMPDLSNASITGQALLFQTALSHILFVSKQLRELRTSVHEEERTAPAQRGRGNTAAMLDALARPAGSSAPTSPSPAAPSPDDNLPPELRRERERARQAQPVFIRAKGKEPESPPPAAVAAAAQVARSNSSELSMGGLPATEEKRSPRAPERSKSARNAAEVSKPASKADKKAAAREAKEREKLAKAEAKQKAKIAKAEEKEKQRAKKGAAGKGAAASSGSAAPAPKPRIVPKTYPVLPDEDELTEWNGYPIPPKQALPKLSFNGMPVSNEEIEEFKEYQRIKLKQEERENLLFLRRKKTAEGTA